MLMAALSSTPVNYFDGVAIVWLLIGIVRGRKRGMTQELIPMLQWIAIVALAGLFYRPFSVIIIRSTSGAFSPLWSNLTAYVLIGFAVHLVFVWLKQNVGQKLSGSDVFGRAEYYFGMVAGLVRFACMLIAMCAVMNSRVYTQAELAETERMQQKNFEDVRFPTYGTIQHAILAESYTGQLIESNLSQFLITSVAPPKPGGETLAQKQQDTINSIIGQPKK